MSLSSDAVEGEQVCSECNADVGNDFAKLSPCCHNVCFRCLSRLLAEKSPTDVLACPSCSEIVTAHSECRKHDDDSGVVNVLNKIKHLSPPQTPRSPERRKHDETGEGRKVTTSPRRLRRTKSKMRVLKVLSDDEQLLKEIHEEYDDDNSENSDEKKKRDNVVRKTATERSNSSTSQDENQRGGDSGEEERPTRFQESGNANSSGTRPPSSRPNARSLRCSSSRRLNTDKSSQTRPQSKGDSEHPDDRKQPRRRSKSLSSSRHGQLRTKSISSSEHGGDGLRRTRTSSGENSAHSTASKLSSKPNEAKQYRSRRGQSRQANPPAIAADDSSISSDPTREDKVIDDGDLTASESDSNRAKEVIAKIATESDPSYSPEAKGRKLLTPMKAIAKLAILGRGLVQSPHKPVKGQKAIHLNSDNDDSDPDLVT